MDNDRPKNDKARTSQNRQQASAENKRIRNRNRGGDNLTGWDDATPELLLRAVLAVTARGCAVQFSLTRDGGSRVVRIVGDGEPYNEYVRATENVDEYLTGLALDFAK